LSPLDQEASKLFKVLDDIAALSAVREKLKYRRIWNVVHYDVSSALIERWIAKTVIGTLCVAAKGDIWRVTGSAILEPPRAVVEAVFGVAPFSDHMGVYVTASVGMKGNYQERVNIAPVRLDTQLAGGLLEFRICRWLMWLCDGNPRQYNLQTPDGRLFGPGKNELIRQGDFNFNNHGVISQRLHFR